MAEKAKKQNGKKDAVIGERKGPRVAMPARGRPMVKPVGLHENSFTVYEPEVKFENIPVQVNVARVKDDACYAGVAKGPLLDNVPITVPTNTAAATVQAMKKRCDYAPQLETEDEFKAGFESIMQVIPQLAEIRVDEELMTEYLLMCAPAKADRLREAMTSDTWTFDGGTKHVFAKQEALLKDHGSQPRVVYQGTDMYNMLTGCVVMELNRRMKVTCSKKNPKNTGNVFIYACGASGEELGEIIGNARGEAVESDAKNNDGSQSASFRKYEAMWYRKHGAPMWFVREFAKNTEVKVWTRYGVTGTVKGQRWSGESTTTTGNSFVHMVLMRRSLETAGVERSTNVHGGDDYLGFVESKPVEEVKEAIETVYKKSGMVAEVVPQRNRVMATFYRKRYPRTSIGCHPVPQHGRVLAKLNIRPNRNDQVGDREYMAGKYLSAAYEHRHVPVIRDLLVDASRALSAFPVLEKRTAALFGDVKTIARKTEEAPIIPDEEYSSYLDTVYGITLPELVNMYTLVASGCADYCNGWTFVGKDGRSRNKEGTSRYQPTYLDSDVVRALVLVDVQT